MIIYLENENRNIQVIEINKIKEKRNKIFEKHNKLHKKELWNEPYDTIKDNEYLKYIEILDEIIKEEEVDDEI